MSLRSLWTLHSQWHQRCLFIHFLRNYQLNVFTWCTVLNCIFSFIDLSFGFTIYICLHWPVKLSLQKKKKKKKKNYCIAWAQILELVKARLISTKYLVIIKLSCATVISSKWQIKIYSFCIILYSIKNFPATKREFNYITFESSKISLVNGLNDNRISVKFTKSVYKISIINHEFNDFNLNRIMRWKLHKNV